MVWPGVEVVWQTWGWAQSWPPHASWPPCPQTWRYTTLLKILTHLNLTLYVSWNTTLSSAHDQCSSTFLHFFDVSQCPISLPFWWLSFSPQHCHQKSAFCLGDIMKVKSQWKKNTNQWEWKHIKSKWHTVENGLVFFFHQVLHDNILLSQGCELDNVWSLWSQHKCHSPNRDINFITYGSCFITSKLHTMRICNLRTPCISVKKLDVE